MYSQNNEEEIILNYFGNKVGSFIEVGAYDPFLFSNTRALVERNWSGIYLEAHPKHLQKFQELYKYHQNIKTIHGALSATADDVIFFLSDDAISTTDLNHKAKWEKGGSVFNEGTLIPAYTIDELVNTTTGFDFLTLDTEGTSFKLFTLLPDDYINSLSMICIEHDGQMKAIDSRLRYYGFKQLLLNGENLIYAK